MPPASSTRPRLACFTHRTPDTAWNATPNEIVDAVDGHLDHLRALHGTTDEDSEPNPDQAAENEAPVLDPEFDRAGLQALKARLG